MKDIYIYGAGGFAREVSWLIEQINEVTEEKKWNFCGYIEDGNLNLGKELYNGKIQGDSEFLISLNKEKYVVIAIGDGKVRKKIVDKLEDKVKFATLIAPDVKISKSVKIGEGTIICPGNKITVDLSIGNHCIANLNCTIGHDATLKDYVTLYPNVNISGNVFLDEQVSIGTGSQIIEQLSVGKESFIGAGAVVATEIPEKCLAVGIPAKVIRKF